jgi:tetratricopeptide (TPR) repeat protein/serine/threonine protein kinase
MTDRGNFAEILDEYLRALEAGNAPDREALLATHPDIAEELQAALLGVDFVHAAAPRLAPEEDSHAQPGRSLGDYRLLRELGRGGMAVVYEAEQVSLGRKVALKILPFAAVLDPKHLQRFKNEAMAAAHLHHPNIVPVYGVGCERGVHYYAMQYVEGQSLATAIQDMERGRGLGSPEDTRPRSTANGPRTPISSHGSNREPTYIRMGAALGVQAAEALDHAHQLGIVHRDIKPGNLLVDLAGTLWITDFGLAYSVKDVGLTITGELLGTIRYMSPEQALAKRVPVDHRTDVYSLGATLYELFTLDPAFPGDVPHLVIQDIASKEPVPPRRLNPALPTDLETVILKAMSKDPASRYATAQEMADDLGRFLENRPIEAKRPGPFKRVAQWSRRHRALVGAATGMLLLAVAGLVIGTALLWREQEQTKAAFGTAQANLDLALEALDQIYIDEAEGQPKIREGLPRDLLQKGLGFYEAFVEKNARNKGLVFVMGLAYQRAGLIFRELGEEERAVQSLDRAISAYNRAIEIDPRDVAAHNGRAIALSELGRVDETLAACDRAIELDPRSALTHSNRGFALRDLGRFEEALAACDRAIELDPRLALAHTNRGNALCELGRFEEALAAFDRAIELDPRFALAHSNRGVALRGLGRAADAIAAYDQAIEIDPRHAKAHYNRGNALRDLGRFEEALAAYDRAIEIYPRFADAHTGRGNALRDLGRAADAIAAHDQAIEIDPRHANAHYNRGYPLRDLGRFEEALAAYDRAIEIKPRFADTHTMRGITLGDLGRVTDAIAAYDQAIEIDPHHAKAHYNRGNALNAEGEVDAAIEAFHVAIRLRPDYAEAHCSLGRALAYQGHVQEALPWLRKGHELGSKRPGWVYPSKEWVDTAERQAELEDRLDRVLSGERTPRDAAERIEFAQLLYAKSRHAESARMWAEAFAEDPSLAEDLAKSHRYDAACSAALAAAGGEEDAAECRGWALEWLRADLAARERVATGLVAELERWKQDPDLAAVRDGLDELPEPEREAWRSLWAAIDLTLATARPAAK